MSKIKLLSIAVIGLLLLNLGLISFLFLHKPAHPPFPGPGRTQPREIIIRKLALDPEQIRAYDILITKHQDNIHAIDRQIRDAKNQLYASLSVSGPGKQDSLISRIGALQMQVEALHYDHFSAIRGLLHPDQVKNFETLTAELSRLFAPPPAPPQE